MILTNKMSYHNDGRAMYSRVSEKSIEIINHLEPGKHSSGCLICCSSPACCPLCSIFPCCGDAEYIQVRREASKYVYIRENSLEWNEPLVFMKRGSCFGLDPCQYEIQDKIAVIYFDDIQLDRITDQTRTCNEMRTCLCGGRGERIRIDSPFCFNICLRSSFPCPCVPICCPTTCCPCVLRHEIYVEDAQKGMYEIKKSRFNALKNPIYIDIDLTKL